MGRVLFVTGTDTGVGKTVASAWLAARAAAAGTTVAYVKPVQTGVAHGEAAGDAAFVAEAAGVTTAELLRFAAPLAPAEAAARAGVTIDVGDVVDRTCAHTEELLIVEGAGGLLVPLTDEVTMADFAAMLGAELVVVTRPTLGTLNHTALTLEAAGRRGLRVATLIVSGWPSEPGLTERTNLERLRAHGIPVEVIPAIDGLSVDEMRARQLRDLGGARASSRPRSSRQ